MRWDEHVRPFNSTIWRADIASFTLCVDQTPKGWRYWIADHSGAGTGFKTVESAKAAALRALEAKLDEWLDVVKQAVNKQESE